MSMLTAQIDELRLMGDGQAAKGEFAVATLLREAADTIESLREKAQDNITERDEVYNAGFDNGVKACLQIIDGYLAYPYSAAENIQKWVDEQWREYES